jgi:hypothetical protein
MRTRPRQRIPPEPALFQVWSHASVASPDENEPLKGDPVSGHRAKAPHASDFVNDVAFTNRSPSRRAATPGKCPFPQAACASQALTPAQSAGVMLPLLRSWSDVHQRLYLVKSLHLETIRNSLQLSFRGHMVETKAETPFAHPFASPLRHPWVIRNPCLATCGAEKKAAEGRAKLTQDPCPGH